MDPDSQIRYGRIKGLLKSDFEFTDTVIETDNSMVAQARDLRTGMMVAVKFLLSSEQASREFSSLRDVHRRLASAARVAKPIRCIETEALLITEWIDGPSLAELLRDRSSSEADVLTALRRAGGWLREFHMMESRHPRSIDFAPKVRQIENLTESVASRLIGRLLIGLMRSRLISGWSRWQDTAVEFGSLHGDFKPENLVFKDAEPVGLDIGKIHQAATVNEIGYFLAQLKCTVYSVHGLFAGARINRLCAEFLRGYEWSSECAPAGLLGWVEREALLRMAHGILSSNRSGFRNTLGLVLVFAIFVSCRVRYEL